MEVGVVKVLNGGEEPLSDPDGRYEKILLFLVLFIYFN